jgi:hypothetical protein
MADININHPAIKALFEVNAKINDLVGWIQAAPYLMADEDKAVDVGQQILGRLYATRDLSLKHMRELALEAGVPSAATVAALEGSLDGAFSSGHTMTDKRSA